MKRRKQLRPLVLLSPCRDRRGVEFEDESISLSNRYPNAVVAAGGVPLVLPRSTDRHLIADLVRRSDGILMTGGDDIQPALYAKKISRKLKGKLGPTDPLRDLVELLLIDEVFAQRKPLLAICRGCQMLNVALGGTLCLDIPTQKRGALAHDQSNRKDRIVHQVALTNGSLLAKLAGTKTIGVNSSHHQAVERIAPPLRATACGADGIIEALELRENKRNMLPYLLGVQFHPERLFERHALFLNLFQDFIGACQSNRGKKL
jgi:putative glutamine amidotransferase